MKELFLVRHAKSSWDYPDLSDFDRPLNPRGKRDAPRIGQFLRDSQVCPDLMLSSPAIRALTTAEVIAEQIQYNKGIVTNSRIYHASSNTLLQVLNEQSEESISVMMFGHNPGFTDFANRLTEEHIHNIPTAGICHIKFKCKRWSEITFSSGEMIFFQYPKGLS